MSPRRDIPLDGSFPDYEPEQPMPTRRTASGEHTPAAVVTPTNKKGPQQGMNRLGMLDEFGRSVSYRNHSNHSGSTAPTVNPGRYRRKSGTPAQTPERSRMRHSIATAPANTPPNSRRAPPPQQPPMLMNARHLEFSAPPMNSGSGRTMGSNRTAVPPEPIYPDMMMRRDPPAKALPAMRAGRDPPANVLPASKNQAGRNGTNISQPNPGDVRRTRSNGPSRGGLATGVNAARSNGHPQRRQPQQQRQPAAKQAEEPKTPARPSYFERIKKTLQQEI